jgi:hypothetical protein
MAENICEQCGTRNEPGAQFCVSCNSFLPWDDTKEAPLPAPGDAPDAAVTAGATGSGRPPEQRVPAGAPADEGRTEVISADSMSALIAAGAAGASGTSGATGDEPAVRSAAGPSLRVEVEPSGAELELDGDPVTFTVSVWNLSPIVDAYRIQAVGAPHWLDVTASELRLLPTTGGQERITARVRPGTVALAGRSGLAVQIRSVAHPQIFLEVTLDLTVPASEVPVTVRLDPSVVKVKDTATGRLQVVVDNVTGNRPRVLRLSGRDPEGVTRFEFAPPVIEVPPGQIAGATLTLTAPVPEPGQQANRLLTISAADEDGTVEATASFQQSASVDVPLGVRLEPALVRVRDAGSASLDAILDNRKGTRTRRVFLAGRDPERLVRFSFAPPSVDVFPGESITARVRVEAPQPEPGQEVSRSLTVVAVQEGSAEVEASATFVQVTSAAPVEAPVVVKLEPSLLRIQDAPTANLHVIIDNRRGASARRIVMSGSDPERAVAFTFWPQVVEVGAGQLARTNLRLDAAQPRPGTEVSRQFTVVAADGDREQEVPGTFVQATSPPPPDEPMTVRLEPPVARVRNAGTGTLTVVADNRGGGRHRQVTLSGFDAEGVVRFSFVPAVLQIPPGQWASASVQMSAPRPEPGEQASRSITVVASDGERDAQATGSLVQESSDRRPIWRVVLTLLGGAMMIIGSLLPWNVGASLGVGVGAEVTGLEWTLPAIDAGSDSIADVEFPDLPDGIDPFLSAGLAMIVLAGLVIFGVLSRRGRLTRLASLVAGVALVAFMVGLAFQSNTGSPGVGAFVAFAGCVIAFIGGLLALPRRT